MATIYTGGVVAALRLANSMGRIRLRPTRDNYLYAADVFTGRIQTLKPRPNADPAKQIVGHALRGAAAVISYITLAPGMPVLNTRVTRQGRQSPNFCAR